MLLFSSPGINVMTFDLAPKRPLPCVNVENVTFDVIARGYIEQTL